jgi:hypothetical protein
LSIKNKTFKGYKQGVFVSSKGLICLVSAFKIDLNLIEVYLIRKKPVSSISEYQSADKEGQPIRAKRPISAYFSQFIWHHFTTIQRWFNTTKKSKDPLKINSANAFHPGNIPGGLIFNFSCILFVQNVNLIIYVPGKLN